VHEVEWASRGVRGSGQCVILVSLTHAQADASVEFGWRRALRGKIDMRLLLEATAQPGNVCVTDLVRRLGRGFLAEEQVRVKLGSGCRRVPTSHYTVT
jgi:hypothetical protein